MQRKFTRIAAVFALIATATVTWAATKGEKEEVDVKGVKCLIAAKKDVNASKSAKWKDGKVFFCCGGCQAKFEKMDKKSREKMAPQANHQLVATKQYEQGGCPFSGGKIDEKQTLEVAGAKVGFCCGNCLAKAKKMSDEDKLTKLFGEDAFKKAKFKLAKKEKDDKKEEVK